MVDFGILSNLASVGLGLFGAFSSAKGSHQQQSFYEEQAALNRQIGAFNAEVAMRTGTESVDAIAQMTRKMIGQQRASFASRGISLEGSPMMILGETLTMGSKKAQEAYFNAEVQATNARYNMQATVSKANNLADAASYKSLTNTIDMAKQLMSLSSVNKYQESTGVAPDFNIFKFWMS